MLLREWMIFSAILFLDGSREFVEEPLGFIAVSSGLVQRPRHFQQRVVHSCLLLYDYRWSICWRTSWVPHCSSTGSSSCFFCWRRNLWEEAWSSTPVLWIERRARLNNQDPSKLGLLESRRLDHLSRSSESNEGPGRATKNPTRLASLPFECHYSR